MDEERKLVDITRRGVVTESHFDINGEQEAFILCTVFIKFLTENPKIFRVFSKVIDLFEDKNFIESLNKSSYVGELPDFDNMIKDIKTLKENKPNKKKETDHE